MLGIDIQSNYDELLAQIVINQLSPYYSELNENANSIISVLQNEKNKFSKTLEKGIREFEKVVKELAVNHEILISGDVAFRLERLRFDFSFSRKLTSEELSLVEDFVNNVIFYNMPVGCEEMPLNKTKQRGAIGVFTDRYNDVVKVHSIGDVSLEICGGPHAKSTAELVKFKIIKEEASSSGVRRIKATLIKN